MLTVLCTVPEWKRTSYANVMIKTKRCKCLLTRRNDVTKSISIYYSSISIYILWRARWSVCRHYNTQIHYISPALWIIHHSFSFSPQIPFTFGTTTERTAWGSEQTRDQSDLCKLQITDYLGPRMFGTDLRQRRRLDKWSSLCLFTIQIHIPHIYNLQL